MPIESHHMLWLDDSQRVTLHDLIDLSGLMEAEVTELVFAGALIPSDHDETPWTFSADCIVTARKACRLRDDLELDGHALALTLGLLEQVRELKAEVSRLRAQQWSTSR